MRDAGEVVERLRSIGDPASVAGRARFGIPETDALGVSVPQLRRLARELGRDHALALALWRTGVHEARVLATLVADPDALTRAQAERWLRDVASWDVCDAIAMNVADRTPWAYEAALEWAAREEEFVRRAGYATMAALAVHDKGAPDARLAAFLPAIEAGSDDARNFVKKAASWALRAIGKRSPPLRRKAVASAKRILRRGTPAARWIARDALRELAPGA